MAEVAQRCDFNPGQTIDSKYVVDKVLGEGAFGKVFRVRYSKGGIYALKLLKTWEVEPEMRKGLESRFVMEFETGRIESEYLVHSYTYGNIYGNPYIIMEYCPDGDFANVKNKNIVRAATEVLYGLKALHSHGKVHRDLKPENVLFKSSGVAALTDFGISGDRNKRMTERNVFGRPQTTFGTYAYMPPEQANRARGNATVLPTTDIFSFGVMMYKVLTGRLPFGTLNNQNDLAVYLINGKNGIWDKTLLQRLADASMWTRIISGCLVPDFHNRIQSVDNVIDMLPKIKVQVPEKDVAFRGYNCDVKGWCLCIMQGEEHGKIYSLQSAISIHHKMITVGREIDNKICIRETQTSYISRHHCTIEMDGERWFVRDGQWIADEHKWKRSLNGTFINSTEVTPDGMELHTGDILSLGDVKLLVINN